MIEENYQQISRELKSLRQFHFFPFIFSKLLPPLKDRGNVLFLYCHIKLDFLVKSLTIDSAVLEMTEADTEESLNSF